MIERLILRQVPARLYSSAAEFDCETLVGAYIEEETLHLSRDTSVPKVNAGDARRK